MKYGIALASALCAIAGSAAHAQTIVNGNFSSPAYLSGWAHNPDTAWIADAGSDGAPGEAWLNNTDPTAQAYISQTITGLGFDSAYVITGYYGNYGGFAGNHALTAEINGVTDFVNNDTGYVGYWKPFSFLFTTGNTTTADLQINAQVGSDTNYFVDGIGIRKITPEPGSAGLLIGLGIAATIAPLRKRKTSKGL